MFTMIEYYLDLQFITELALFEGIYWALFLCR